MKIYLAIRQGSNSRWGKISKEIKFFSEANHEKAFEFAQIPFSLPKYDHLHRAGYLEEGYGIIYYLEEGQAFEI